MRLGGSLARRRGGKRRPAKSASKSKPKQKRTSTPRPPSKMGRLWGTALGLALFGWALGYLVSTQLLFPAAAPTGDLFDVPDLRGLGLATARERLAGANLTLGPIDSLLHPAIPATLIVGQSPLPGQVATAQAEVRVTISMGPQLRSVPDVTRLDEDRARIVLETSGFVVTVDTAQSEVPRGRVIESLPPADSVVPLPAQIVMFVSTGPPLVEMPFVLGMVEAEALQLLDSLGLVVAEVTEVFRFGRDQGVVVEQEPAAEMELERGSEVRLSIGRRGGQREQ